MQTILIDRAHPLRPAAEALVQRVYERVYHACPTQFPDLMAARCTHAEGPLVTCGVRYAASGFFSSCYLDEPLPVVLSRALHRPILASEIIEVTTLASTANRLAMGLIQDVIALAREVGMTCGLFTTTPALAQLVRRAGIPLVWVADAVPNRVSNPTQWGRYYHQSPAVYVADDRLITDPPIKRSSASVKELRAHV